ncbi:sensor histidine kinase [Streptococcus acidominimus]|uniref:Putative histidine kinase n=1 Tax=Streptococcus acidominimus TaxID=1326 RepID=A0A1Q8EBY4_STRAI|nr:sensor histidine kinase [Streptococcus acidominimus]OLF49308.1 sensor histidine kinase [Streptococcus acidominimus]SUN04796.1 putative histidine kinase [Streptococcus acidominimus]
MKRFWLNSLLRIYTSAMIVIMLFIACLLAYSDWHAKEQEAQRVVRYVSGRMSDEVDYHYRHLSQVVDSLTQNVIQLEGLYKYFSLSPSEYASWLLNTDASQGIDPSLHRNILRTYMQNEAIEGIALALNDYKTVFVSSRQLKGGRQIGAESFRPDPQAFPILMYDQLSEQVIGTAYVTVDKEIFRRLVENTAVPLVIRITSPYEQEMMVLKENRFMEVGEWVSRETDHNYEVDVALPKGYLLRLSLVNTLGIVGTSFILSGILYLLLKRVFKNYQVQVSDIVETMQVISQGDMVRRVDVATKERELLLIADNTNQMLDNLNQNLHDIYQLQLSQKDATLRALQAQINPHFMYNTLEFIRMYAVVHDQDELADIIYEFSSLLRNNISDEKTTTLEQELEFCRKYSYLCMMRYPKSVAYDYKIAPELRNFRIPKFSIQPLVENYFAHGIDHHRFNNAISVKVFQRDSNIEILIRDNGKGMPEEVLKRLQTILQQRRFDHGDQEQHSIGIINVHERFVLFFGDCYEIQLHSEQGQGVTYSIFIRQEDS